MFNNIIEFILSQKNIKNYLVEFNLLAFCFSIKYVGNFSKTSKPQLR